MKLHFFTVNDIEDYRKHYRFAGEAQCFKKITTARTPEEFDQEFFCYYLKRIYNVPQEIFETKI